jgi:hypothetical protein
MLHEPRCVDWELVTLSSISSVIYGVSELKGSYKGQ